MENFELNNGNFSLGKKYLELKSEINTETNFHGENNENNPLNQKPQLIPRPEYNPEFQVNSTTIITSTTEINHNNHHSYHNNHQINSHRLRDRISIFVDGNNMFYAQQKNGWFFDPRKVIDYFSEESGFMLINAFWYTGLKDSQDQRGFRDALISLGYTVRTKILKEYYDDSSGRFSQKANLDIEIVVDMFNTVDQYDRVVLFSGDGDFERAIELLRSKNTHITVVSTDGMIARELRNATDRYMDLNEIRNCIEKRDY
ncbi:MAG: NYN domain-containing protein [Cyanobacteria bacterium]|nr:NYN domain-containing protein [Cyanobacteria bacterium CG_2015-16_32_12]NCO78662.1 NYN domain-containing protein [Cyanobacteria bacterium CG_2015-22_32_23]NCQ04345.1 NYN domain-containing protein [Cyanobacteria bacterium CG_2015-09_32_10]NCQ42787.1 NYN domain-containing protein [Cyanobacteria bacterium CG_2015-04_32_10]NCS84786.1 NYN domain-containing protein [Cyanobacteria bacterium CG_2015-02_32_10]